MMSLMFADTHNLVAYLKKSNASEGFNKVIDFLNGSYIKYALTVNPTIYMSCIKQFWNTVVVKQSNDFTRLQALVDRKKVVVTEAAIRYVLRLDDADGFDCLPNDEIFAELARMEIVEQGDAEEQVQDNVDDAAQGDDTAVLGDDGRMIADLDRDTGVALMDDERTEKKAENAQEAVDVVTTAKLITEVVVAVSESVTAASATVAAVPAATITAAP
nr:xylulose kinase-1 [Tanacetum cinerariifolium]